MQRTAGLFILLVASDLDPIAGVDSSKTLAKYLFGICLLCLVLLCSALVCFRLFVGLSKMFTVSLLFQTIEGASSSFDCSL